MQPSTLAKRVFFLVFLGAIIFYLYGLGHLPLVGPDEPRYAQVAREMFLRHDLVTPTLGGHNWFEKPALLYWLMIAAFKLFGPAEWTARLGPAFCGILTVAAVWFATRRVDRHFSHLSAFVCATTLGLIVFARAASVDIVLTMTSSWALAFFLAHEVSNDRRDRNKLLAEFYVFVGVSLIAKGLVGVVIPFGVVGLYFLFRRRLPDRSLFASLLWGIPLALVVSALWYGPVIGKHGYAFIDQFFIQHHFARYISNKYKHPQPFYFYFTIILLLAMPWTGALIESLVRTRPSAWRGENPMSKTRAFALAWLALPILFFSFSGSKLPGYILPALPATALFVGDLIVFGKSRWTMRVTGLICLCLAITGIVFALKSGVLSPAHSALITLPVMLAGVFSIAWSQSRFWSTILVGGTTVLTLIVVLNAVAPRVSEVESVRDLLRRADERGYSTLPVFARSADDRSAEFYASGRVVYDDAGEPVMLERIPDMRAAAQTRGDILVIVPADYDEIVRRLSDMEIIASNGRVALIVVHHVSNVR